MRSRKVVILGACNARSKHGSETSLVLHNAPRVADLQNQEVSRRAVWESASRRAGIRAGPVREAAGLDSWWARHHKFGAIGPAPVRPRQLDQHLVGPAGHVQG